MSEQGGRRIPLWLIIPVSLIVGLLAVIATTRRPAVLAPGQSVRYDDFEFHLVGVNRTPVVNAVEYLVKLRIHNKARRVFFTFPRSGASFYDPESGKTFEVDGAAQKSYEKAMKRTGPDPIVLKAGESATTEYVFRLPPEVTDPRLRIAPGGRGSLWLEDLFVGIKEFRVNGPAEEPPR